jgi:hypothetical protein
MWPDTRYEHLMIPVKCCPSVSSIAKSLSLDTTHAPMSALGQKQTCATQKPMSAKGQKRTSLDHFIGALLEMDRYVKAKRLGGL